MLSARGNSLRLQISIRMGIGCRTANAIGQFPPNWNLDNSALRIRRSLMHSLIRALCYTDMPL